jgi:hypothetical protein
MKTVILSDLMAAERKETGIRLDKYAERNNMYYMP